MTKKLVWFAVAVMVTLLGIGILWQFRGVVGIVLAALALGATVRPVTERWARQRLFVRIALIFLFLLSLAGAGYLTVQAGGAVVREIRGLANTVAVQDAWQLPEWLQTTPILQSLVTNLPPPSQLFAALTGEEGQLVLPAILGLTRGIAGLVSGVFIVLFLSLYWSLNQGHFERLWLSLLPSGQRSRMRSIWRAIEADLGAYIRSQVIQSLLAGLVLGIGYWVLGSPYATLLAFTGALAGLIPLVGLPLALILPLLMGLLTSVESGLLMMLYTLLALIALEVWVKPRLSIHQQQNPILTVVILIALANAFGLIGIIAAPPLSAVIQILWSRLVVQRESSRAGAQISDIRERHTRIQETISAMEEPPMKLVTSSMERLTQLLDKAEPLIESALQAGRTELPGNTLISHPSSVTNRSTESADVQ